MKQTIGIFAAFLLLCSTVFAADSESMESLVKQAKSGDADLQYDLAVHYLFEKRLDANNVEMAPDYAEAFKWLKLSADGGNKEAMALLSLMYERGRGVQVDREKADFWAKKAAE